MWIVSIRVDRVPAKRVAEARARAAADPGED
jgi:hypothetical protein